MSLFGCSLARSARVQMLLYTQLIKTEDNEEYVSKAAETIEDARKLVEAGFEYICEIEDVKLFRKRK